MKKICFLMGILIVFMTACQPAPTVSPTIMPTSTIIAASPTPVPTATTETIITATLDPDAGYAQVGDIKMYYVIKGSGKPLLLLHGGLTTSEDWYGQVPAFAESYQVITPDSRGQGRTADGDGPITYHLMAEDIVKLMDILEIDSAYIVGASDGGIIGIDLALHHPERVKALVAYGANITPDGIQQWFLDYIRTASAAELAGGYAVDYQRLSPTPDHLYGLVNKIRTMWLNEPNFTLDELGSIHVPTLVLDGEREELIKKDQPKAIAQAIPNAKLVILPFTGHFAPWDDAEAFNQAVLDFLKDY